ncbi:MAG: hypothetical protein LBR26_04345 [Prevotella sp.]|jgi:hypothetical protein|nr:hypothetical protein [Prevotella sp.]
MKQTIFETRQRADELMKEVLSIWQKSDRSEELENLENDPVLSLLITAFAYLQNETDNEIERLKNDVLEEYARMLIPHALYNARPASIIVKTSLQNKEAFELSEHTPFTLSDAPYRFIPLLRTRVLGGNVDSVLRMDERRWKVTMSFPAPVNNLSRFTFAILNPNFREVKVSLNGQALHLVNTWEYANLPLSKSFTPYVQLYNQCLTYMTSTVWFDLFAQQNLRLFCVIAHKDETIVTTEANKRDFIFEFTGINDQFEFNKSQLLPDCSVLANAAFHSVTLSSASPMARIAGTGVEGDPQFLQLVHPSANQLYKNTAVEVRRTAADRFNSGSLVRLTNSLLNKLNTDFYAFQNAENLRNGQLLYQLQVLMERLLASAQQSAAPASPGVYLILKKIKAQTKPEDVSLNAGYLTTDGSRVNASLSEKSVFSSPSGLISTHAIAPPVPGSNEVQGINARESLAGYYMATRERLVTPADIKAFCYNELLARLDIVPELVYYIRVGHRRQADRRQPGYTILVEIILNNNPVIRRSMTDRIGQTEWMLKKMIEVRSANIYPVTVHISIKDDA